MFGESGFAHGDLLQGYIQYAGRSLNVNGPVYRDAYKILCLQDLSPATLSRLLITGTVNLVLQYKNSPLERGLFLSMWSICGHF
ncbi:TPA: hypothetical protein MJG14_09050 [Klebsiella pneumoniae]|nr:hypothetical protein [Klebsiella pneumoniae]